MWTLPPAHPKSPPAVRIGLLERAWQGNPGDARLAYRLGEALVDQAEFAKAAEIFSKVLQLEPGFLEARYRMAQCLMMLRRFPAVLDALAAEWPSAAPAQAAEAHYLRGAALDALGRVADAEAAYRAVLRALPAHSPTLRKLSAMLRSDGRIGELAELCGGLLAAGVRHPRLLMEWGRALVLAGEVKLARTVLLDCARLERVGLAPLAGFTSVAAFNAALAADLLANPNSSEGHGEDPVYRGPRVHHLLKGRRPELIEALYAAVQREVDAYVAGLAPYDGGVDHWLDAKPARASMTSWGLILREDDHPDWHVHPQAWLSCVYYVSVPGVVTEAGDGPGCIEFGPPPEIAERLRGEIQPCRVAPRPGDLLISPGHYHHRTIPTGVGERRISVAMDVIPAAPTQARRVEPQR